MDTPDYLDAVIGSFKMAEFERLTYRSPLGTSPPIVISVVRDELHLMPSFLAHYRAGGVDRFFIIDNGSKDGTIDYLAEQTDVSLYRITDRFDWRIKQGWINLAMVMCGIPSWFVYADADELIVYDDYPKRSFADLCAEMDKRSIRRVRGMLVDMYGDQPLISESCADLREWVPFFDISGYKEAKYSQLISRKGGSRLRAFGGTDVKFNPELTKYPIFKLRAGEYFVNPHSHWPYPDNFISPCLLGILHYKFTPAFGAKMRRAIEEKSYWDASHEYRCYAARIERDPNLSLLDPVVSRRYTDVSDLIDASIIDRITPSD